METLKSVHNVEFLGWFLQSFKWDNNKQNLLQRFPSVLKIQHQIKTLKWVHDVELLGWVLRQSWICGNNKQTKTTPAATHPEIKISTRLMGPFTRKRMATSCYWIFFHQKSTKKRTTRKVGEFQKSTWPTPQTTYSVPKHSTTLLAKNSRRDLKAQEKNRWVLIWSEIVQFVLAQDLLRSSALELFNVVCGVLVGVSSLTHNTTMTLICPMSWVLKQRLSKMNVLKC